MLWVTLTVLEAVIAPCLFQNKGLKMKFILKKTTVSLLLTSIFTSYLLAVPKECQKIKDANSMDGLTSKDSRCLALVIAEKKSETTPLKIDKETTLTSVTASGNMIIHDFNAILTDVRDIKSLESFMRKGTINSNCTTPPSRAAIDIGAEFILRYYDEKNIHQFSIAINKEVCEKAGL